MVIRLLFYLALAGAIIWLLRRLALIASNHPDTSARRGVETDVLRCAYCGLHVPREEAVMADNGQPFCSLAHQQQYGKG